MQNLVVDF